MATHDFSDPLFEDLNDYLNCVDLFEKPRASNMRDCHAYAKRQHGQCTHKLINDDADIRCDKWRWLSKQSDFTTDEFYRELGEYTRASHCKQTHQRKYGKLPPLVELFQEWKAEYVAGLATAQSKELARETISKSAALESESEADESQLDDSLSIVSEHASGVFDESGFGCNDITPDSTFDENDIFQDTLVTLSTVKTSPLFDEPEDSLDAEAIENGETGVEIVEEIETTEIVEDETIEAVEVEATGASEDMVTNAQEDEITEVVKDKAAATADDETPLDIEEPVVATLIAVASHTEQVQTSTVELCAGSPALVANQEVIEVNVAPEETVGPETVTEAACAPIVVPLVFAHHSNIDDDHEIEESVAASDDTAATLDEQDASSRIFDSADEDRVSSDCPRQVPTTFDDMGSTVVGSLDDLSPPRRRSGFHKMGRKIGRVKDTVGRVTRAGGAYLKNAVNEVKDGMREVDQEREELAMSKAKAERAEV